MNAMQAHTTETAGFLEALERSQEREISAAIALIRGLAAIVRRKWIVARVTGATGIVAAAVSLFLPLEYTSITRIMTPQQTPSSAVLLANQFSKVQADSLSALGGTGLGLKNPNDIYIGLLSSRPVADAIIQKFGLLAEYHSRDLTSARKTLSSNTRMMSEKSGLILISVTDNDKARSAGIANAYTAQLRDLTKTLAVTEASQRRMFYEEKLSQAKQDLLAAEISLKQIQQQKGIVQPDAQAKAAIQGMSELQAQIAAKEMELRALRSYSTDRNPDVKIVEIQLSSLQAAMQRMDQGSSSRGTAGLGLKTMASAGLEFLAAQHELEYRQVLFDLLLKQFDAARLDESREAAVVQVVEPALPPDRKSAPHRAAITLLSASLAFLLACLYVVLQGSVRANSQLAGALADLKTGLIQFRS